ncbi:hypothetical protein VPNG_08714 [Cytospora leucostoma]|uniref:Thiamine-triphosphatase n=1 Tax=Cytospora leucostoma TaxID=1230097 RepID=A0A423W2G3_9PEZI|nr:hypothetical protein VPNG_08714 [Cytospora leucostoma]
MKATRGLAKLASSASPRRLIGSLLPVSHRAVTQAYLPMTGQQSGRRLSARSRAQPSNPKSPQKTMPSSILEIERKFAPTKASMQQLASNTGTPPFESLIHHGTTHLEDVYYDTADELLCSAGVWLRRRSDKWEAKVRVGGDFTNSAFEEITNVNDISEMLSKLVPGAALDSHHGPLGGRVLEVAKLVSERNTFLVDGKFTVVLDETDFGHVVGEVELEREVLAIGEDDATGASREGQEREKLIVDMDREIDDFMKGHAWAFPPGKPVGKLSAYFALKKRQ